MRLLLDTHAILWAVRQPEKLGDAASRAIRLRANERLVSTASLWEMGIKHAKGKLPEAEPLLEDWPGMLRLLNAVLLPIGADHALTAPRLGWDHTDPFDRMLAAQSLLEQAPLVGMDSQFDAVEGLVRVW